MRRQTSCFSSWPSAQSMILCFIQMFHVDLLASIMIFLLLHALLHRFITCLKNRIFAQVKAPWMKMFFYGELDTYVIPGFNGVVTLGGSRSFDSENTKLCPHESTAIRERCETLIPSLKNAEIVRQEVGLRPYRESGVRVGDGNRINNHSKAIVST